MLEDFEALDDETTTLPNNTDAVTNPMTEINLGQREMA